MSDQLVTVFGGTGFLGRRIVGHLRKADFAVRIASRHPPTSGGNSPGIEAVRADVDDDASVETAVSGAWAVVNAISLYVERGTRTFRSIHVAAAERVAAVAHRAGSERMVHVSGIGADSRSALAPPDSSSSWCEMDLRKSSRCWSDQAR